MIYSRPISIQAMLCIVRIAHKCMQDLGACQVENLVRLAAQSVVLTMTLGEHVVQVARFMRSQLRRT